MLDGGEYLVTGTATSIASALGITDIGKKAYKQIILRAAGANAFVGKSNVTTTTNRCAELLTTDTSPLVLGGGDGESLNIDHVYLVGTQGASNIVFIALVS